MPHQRLLAAVARPVPPPQAVLRLVARVEAALQVPQQLFAETARMPRPAQAQAVLGRVARVEVLQLLPQPPRQVLGAAARRSVPAEVLQLPLPLWQLQQAPTAKGLPAGSTETTLQPEPAAEVPLPRLLQPLLAEIALPVVPTQRLLWRVATAGDHRVSHSRTRPRLTTNLWKGDQFPSRS